MNETLRREECNNDDVYEFMQLLKKLGGYERESNRMAEIIENEWTRVVKKVKRKSILFVFLKRNYSIYKCALESTKMISILVRFYNMVMRKGYYLKKWVKLLDVILEKGKGPIIGKLHTIKLIEVDLQLLMRIFIRGRMVNTIENDHRILKFNYESRTNYSIENTILEKCLMYDLATRDEKEMMHNISDLEACYNRKLPNIRCLVEESVGIEREAAKLFAKILLVMQYHICTSYGISKNSYKSSC